MYFTVGIYGTNCKNPTKIDLPIHTGKIVVPNSCGKIIVSEPEIPNNAGSMTWNLLELTENVTEETNLVNYLYRSLKHNFCQAVFVDYEIFGIYTIVLDLNTTNIILNSTNIRNRYSLIWEFDYLNHVLFG